MTKDGKLKIDSMMVMILVSVRCRSKTLYIRRSFRSLWQKLNLQSSKLVASKGKEVNIAGDSDDALVCCVENTVEDRIRDSGVSFHATYCKEELERFKLCSGKVRLAHDMTLNIAGIGDVVLKISFGTSWYLKDVRIVMLKMVSETPLQFGVAERLSQTFRAESMGLRAEPLKILYADLVSTTYLLYRIPYVLIGLRIPEEEWRGKDTSLAHLKLSGYEESLENDSIVAEHGLSSEITQILGGSSDTSEGSKNNRSFEDSGRSDEEYSEDRASCKEGGS
ncbi:hypothetical protein Tco_0088764 [Tanacetum coccineum]